LPETGKKEKYNHYTIMLADARALSLRTHARTMQQLYTSSHCWRLWSKRLCACWWI